MATTTPNETVREFYATFDEPIHTGVPSGSADVLPDERLKIKLDLIIEEVSELLDASYSKAVGQKIRDAWKAASEEGLLENPERDFVEMFDAVLDIDVVVNGLAIETNMPVVDGLAEVHRGNMSKLDDNGKAIRSDGTDGKPLHKILKGPNYVAPDLKSVLEKHGYEG